MKDSAGIGQKAGVAEWRLHAMLPLAAAIGYATSVIHIYGLGPYIEPISEAFGWSRTETSYGLTIQTLLAGSLAIPVGMAVDRIGPRFLGLLGVPLTCAGFALLSTATGSVANWVLLWAILALCTLAVQATIWTSAVATRFTASRGMAFAVTLCGASVAQALFPPLGTWLIENYGWRNAMPIQAMIWVAIALPVLWLFFKAAPKHGANDPATPASLAKAEGLTLREGLASSIYWRLMLASLLFTFTIIALTIHYVPILTGRGIDKMQAASLASLIGFASIAGRLGTGFLLDRYRGSLVGAAVFLLPVLGCLVLISAGSSLALAAVAAVLIGLTLGAEVDVIVYLTTKHFGLAHFGALYGGMLAALSLGTATGPLAAAKIFDTAGNYQPFLWLTIGMMIASSAALITLPRPRYG